MITLNRFLIYGVVVLSGLILGLAIGGTIASVWGVAGVFGLVGSRMGYQLLCVENEPRTRNGKKPI